MRIISVGLFVAVSAVATTTSTQAETRLEQVMEFADMFGFTSGAANKCPNLTLAKTPEIREAIRDYRRSDTPAVRERYQESRRTAIAGVRKDKKRTCDFMAKTFPWMFEEKRDKNR